MFLKLKSFIRIGILYFTRNFSHRMSRLTSLMKQDIPLQKKLYGTYMSKLYVKYRGHIIVKYMSHICILNLNEVEDIY